MGYVVDKGWLKTSQNPGKCHSAASTVARSSPLDAVMAYENEGVVRRIATDLSIKVEKAAELFGDLKRFLWAASQAEHGAIPPPLIDEAWHAFVLFTEDYAGFCQQFFGEFLHHQPHTGEGLESNTVTIPSITLFHGLFGGKPSDNWDYVNMQELKAA